MKKIQQIDCIELLKSLPNNSVDLIFTDPPYNLSTQWVIDEYGKPNPKTKAIDFMGKWDGLNGKILEEWFKEANRVLKYGGRVLMFGMDRQIWVNCYYANFSGLVQQQSLYWYFASSFPKAADLSKNLDKYFGEEREVVGKGVGSSLKKQNEVNVEQGFRPSDYYEENDGSFNITKPSSDLAKKYDGFKYSISPVKQTNETIMVFQKPYKTGSCLHDTLAYENGDEECCCGALNIDDNRIPSGGNEINARKNKGGSHGIWDNSKIETGEWNGNDGRFPAQSFVDSETAKLLDEQSGISKSSGGSGDKSMGGLGKNGKYNTYALDVVAANKGGLGDTGGCSKILHKCDYDERDIELYYYCPKVDKKERNMGMDDFTEEKTVGHNRFDKCKTCNGYILQNQDRKSACKCENPVREDNKMSGNYHPTVKPLNLLLKILNLFKTPNPQVCVDTFAGSGSIPIAAELLGFEVIAGDLDEGFVEISNARLDYAVKNKISLLKKHKQPEPIKPSSTNQSFF